MGGVRSKLEVRGQFCVYTYMCLCGDHGDSVQLRGSECQSVSEECLSTREEAQVKGDKKVTIALCRD